MEPRPPLHTDPTLVIAVGPVAAIWVERSLELLRRYHADVLPVFRAGVLTDGQLRNLDPASPPDAEPAGAVEGVTAWLRDVCDVAALARVRAAGYRVGSGPDTDGLLSVRVVLVFPLTSDGELGPAAALEVLDRAVAERAPRLPPRLACLAVAGPSPSRSAPGWLTEALGRLAASRHLQRPSMALLSPDLSTGGALSEGDLGQVVPALLLAALAPAGPQQDWILERPAAEPHPYGTFGVGLLAVPLPEVEAALAEALAGDLLAALSVDAEVKLSAEEADRMVGLFSESGAWRELYADLHEEAMLAEEGFEVSLREGQILRELPEMPWQRWAGHLAEYDAQWGTWVAQDWLRRIRQRACIVEQSLHDALTAGLDADVVAGQDVFGRLRARIRILRSHLRQRWDSDRGGNDEAPPGANSQALRVDLEVAIAAVPNPLALGVRLVLGASFLVWTSVALVRWGWLDHTGWVCGGLAAAAVALVALAVGVILVRVQAEKRVDESRRRYLDGIQAKYCGLLRAEGLRAMRRLRESLLDRLDRLDAEIDRMKPRVEVASQAAKRAAEAFAPESVEPVQPVVRDWSQLGPVRPAIWKPVDLRELLPQLLASSWLDTYQALRAQTLPDRVAGDVRPVGDLLAQVADPLARRCAVAARELVRQRAGTRLHAVSFFIRQRFADDQATIQHLEEQLTELHGQAAMLWPDVTRISQTWHVLPVDDVLARTVAPPDVGLPLRELLAPGMMGILVRGEVRYE